MRKQWRYACITLFSLLLALPTTYASKHHHYVDVEDRMPSQISPPGEKVIIIDPRMHTFSAYDEDGTRLRTGLATTGAGYCRDLHRSCRTKVGTFRIYSLGSRSCVSSKFPLPRGGAPIPYCMFFHGGQAIHGSYQVVDGNVSHGCVRLHVEDAKWLRFDFAEGPNSSNGYRGTKVIIKSY